jgi:hypothetical protein
MNNLPIRNRRNHDIQDLVIVTSNKQFNKYSDAGTRRYREDSPAAQIAPVEHAGTNPEEGWGQSLKNSQAQSCIHIAQRNIRVEHLARRSIAKGVWR